MTAKHTQGEWIVQDFAKDDLSIDIHANGTMIAATWPERLDTKDSRDEVIANARLIAAAPKLLEALENCVNYWPSALNDDLQDRTREEAQAVIAAAKGEA